MTARSLDEVAEALRALLLAEDRVQSFRPIAARLVLRTGVDLRQPRPDQEHDPEVISDVISALTDMGFGLDPHAPSPRRTSP